MTDTIRWILTVLVTLLLSVGPLLLTAALAWGRLRAHVDRLIGSLDRLSDKVDSHSERLAKTEAQIEAMGGE